MKIDRDLAQQLFIHEQRGDLADVLADLPDGTIGELARKGYLKVEHEWGEIVPKVSTTELVWATVLSPHAFTEAMDAANKESGDE